MAEFSFHRASIFLIRSGASASKTLAWPSLWTWKPTTSYLGGHVVHLEVCQTWGLSGRHSQIQAPRRSGCHRLGPPGHGWTTMWTVAHSPSRWILRHNCLLLIQPSVQRSLPTWKSFVTVELSLAEGHKTVPLLCLSALLCLSGLLYYSVRSQGCHWIKPTASELDSWLSSTSLQATKRCWILRSSSNTSAYVPQNSRAAQTATRHPWAPSWNTTLATHPQHHASLFDLEGGSLGFRLIATPANPSGPALRQRKLRVWHRKGTRLHCAVKKACAGKKCLREV